MTTHDANTELHMGEVIRPTVKTRALAIVAALCKCDLASLTIFSAKPDNLHVYNMPIEPSWFVYAPWGDGWDGRALRSSRVILVSKRNGALLYDGSANDEG